MTRDEGDRQRGRDAPVAVSGGAGASAAAGARTPSGPGSAGSAVTSAQWLVLAIPVEREHRYDLAAALIELGAGGVEERGERVVAHLPLPGEPERALRRTLADIERAVPELFIDDFEWDVVEDEDWSARWKEGLAARRVGRRVWTAPSWALPESLGGGEFVVVVDPAMAFGTGEHGTTRGCLRLLERAVRPGDAVLDVGTGTGILAVAAARLGASDVLAVDDDPQALENARVTVEANGVGERVRLELARVDADFLRRRAHDRPLIVANVLSGVLHPMLSSFAAAMRPGSRLILSGILEEEADWMLRGAAAAGLAVDAEEREEGWWSVLLRPARRQD